MKKKKEKIYFPLFRTGQIFLIKGHLKLITDCYRIIYEKNIGYWLNKYNRITQQKTNLSQISSSIAWIRFAHLHYDFLRNHNLEIN